MPGPRALLLQLKRLRPLLRVGHQIHGAHRVKSHHRARLRGGTVDLQLSHRGVRPGSVRTAVQRDRRTQVTPRHELPTAAHRRPREPDPAVRARQRVRVAHRVVTRVTLLLRRVHATAHARAGHHGHRGVHQRLGHEEVPLSGREQSLAVAERHGWSRGTGAYGRSPVRRSSSNRRTVRADHGGARGVHNLGQVPLAVAPVTARDVERRRRCPRDHRAESLFARTRR